MVSYKYNIIVGCCFQTYLKELLRLMFPKFHSHLQEIGEALGLLFVHRYDSIVNFNYTLQIFSIRFAMTSKAVHQVANFLPLEYR